MSAISDANFTYSVVSTVGRTLAIIGINPSNATYSASNANWGAFPAIPAVYAGSNTAYNGNGVPANAFKVAEIGANAFDSLTAFAATTLTAAFLPANLKLIGDRAFANVKLSGTLTIPATLDSVGFQAFHGTLVSNIVIGSSTNSTIVAHLANLTSVIQQEINDRAAADASLNALKAPIDNPVFTGIASIPTANIGLATVSSASIATAAISVANLTSAHLSAMNVVGNASFTGNVSVTGAWNFTVKPKINGEGVATESFVNDQIATIAGTGLITALDTLTELASAIGGDSSFATNLITSNASISTTLSNETVTRSNAALALSGALSTSASSLTVVDSALSTALSGEVSARSASVAGLSTALSTATSSLQVNNSAFSTALSTELSARSSEITSASITRSTSESSLQLIDATLSGVLSTEVSARGSAVASLVPVISASRASLSTVDANANAALSTETSTRVSAVASLNLLQTTAFASLSGITSSLSTALSTEASARTAAGSSLSASASVAAVSLQQTNTQFSIALAAEVGARGTSVSSLATSISASVSALVSANSAAATALGAETAVRADVVPSAAASVTNAVASVSASVLAHSNAMIAETSVRSSQIQSISTAASTAVASLSNANSGISSALIVEGATRSTAVSTAIQNILNGAPTRFNTLEKIASEMITNPVITINDSTISRVSALRTAVSSETSARVSAVASLSNTAIPSLSVVDAGLISALSTETSARGSAVASLSGALSAASVSFAAVNGVLSGALSSETVVRASAVGSVSTAVASVAAVLGAADASLSTAISSETVTRVSDITSISTAALQSFAWLNVAHTATSTAVATETSTRNASIVSVSGAIAASFASLQTANGALSGSVSALSAALAPKATTAYLDGKIATLLNGAPAQLNTLAEMAAALGNNPNFASSISTALSAKGNAADASTVSLAIASKGGLAQLTSLATVVSNKADAAAMTTAINSVISLNNAVNALSTTVSTLQTTGGSVNGTTVAVSGVDIPTLAARIQEFYYKMGTENPSWGIINANGTINYKVNRLANPSLVSNVLLFEYGGNGAVNKVVHAITVQFDAAQTSVTVTGGVGNPTTTVNNLVLDANSRHTFRIDYAGDLNYFQANNTAVSIVALDTKYKLAPSAPTVTAPALLLPSFLSLDTNTVTIKYTGNPVDVPTSEPLFIYANPRGTGPEWFAVVKQGMNTAISNYASGTSAPFKPPGQSEPVPFNNIVTTLMTHMSNMFISVNAFNQPIASWDTSNVTHMDSMFPNASAFNQPIGAWNTSKVTTMYGMFYNASVFNQNISAWNTGAVTDMSYVFNGATLFNQPIGAWNTSNVTTMHQMFYNANAFNQNISAWNTGAVTDMSYAFYGATAFNQTLSAWDVRKVTPKPPTQFSTGSQLTAQNAPVWFPVVLDANTIKYVGSAALVPASEPLFIYANPRGTGPEWFAVVKQSENMKNAISNYASGTSAPFKPGQSDPVPFNNIVTTLMTDMSSIFANKTSFNSPIASWDTSNVTNMNDAFYGTTVFNQPIDAWNTLNVTTMINMFRNTNAFNQPINAWNTSNVTNMTQMFYDATAFNQPIGAWNTSKVTDMQSLFASAAVFNQPIGAWNTGAVTNMNFMFQNASAFNQNISGWNVSNVSPKPPSDFITNSAITAQNIPAVFLLSLDANGITVKYIGSHTLVPTSEPVFIQANPRGTGNEWFAVVKQGMNTAISNYASGTSAPFKPGQSDPVSFNNIVTTLMSDMSFIFMNKSSFNSPIASWDTSNVTNMTSAFFNATSFNQPIGAWNTSNVTVMNDMFRNTNAFNQNIGAWNTSNVTNMLQMFWSATAFNQNISAWNTSNVTTMNGMFGTAAAFNQPIGAWNTGAVTNMNFMFYNASAFNQNISAWNVIKVSPKPPTDFSTGSQLTAHTSPFGVTFTAPIISNSGIITYSGTTASMTYTVASGVTAVQVRKASDNTVIASTTSVSGTSASVSLTITETVSIVVVALGNAAGRESAASAPQTLLARFAVPVKASEPVYTTVSANSYTASMTYTVAAGVTQVQVRKASDNTPISGATSSINSLIATITVPFTNTFSIVVVALINANGRESLPSVAQTLVGQYAAPTLLSSVTYSGNTASMTYSVHPGVSAVTVLKSDLTALPADVLVNTIINTVTSERTVSVAFTTSMSIVVIAEGNATGSQSAASAPLALLANFTKPTLGSITYSGNTAIMTYNVAEGVSAVSVLQPNLSALPSDASVTTNTISGTTATLHISLSGSRGSLSFVVVALTNATGRQSVSDTQFISTGISDLTFTKSSNLWYFGFNCSNPSSLSGLNIHITWTFTPGNGATGVTTNYSSATIANGANSLLISDPNNWLNSFLTGKVVNVSINYVVSDVSKNIATSFIPNPLTGGPYTMSVSNVNANAYTCTLVIPTALDQQRDPNRTWIYFHYFIDATTNVTVVIPNPNGVYTISGSIQSSISNVQLPPSLWGRPLRSALLIVNLGTSNTGDYVVQQGFTSNDTYTLIPTVLFPVETNQIITYGMSWQGNPNEINDVRLWKVFWTVNPIALNVASPNYVSKVRIRFKRDTDSTYRFTGVYNYADGVGYAMFHTNVYTNQGQILGTWITEIRAENADGTITNNYVVRSDYYGPQYASAGNSVNLTQLASVANDGYTLLYGDNVTNLF